jgi:WD40 repeat protein
MPDATDVVQIWNAADLSLEVELTTAAEHQLGAMGFHPDGSTLLAWGYYSHAWSTATWQLLREPSQIGERREPWPSRIVVANDGSTSGYYSSPSGSTSPTLSVPSHDATLVATGELGGGVSLTEKVSRTLLFRFAAQGGPITGLAFSPDDSLLAATSEDGSLFTWRVRDGSEAWHSGASIFPGELVAASRDGTKVVLKSKGDHSLVSALDGNLLGKFPLEDYASCATDKSAERLACSNEEGPNFVSVNGVPRIAGIDPAAPELFGRGAVALVPDAPVFVQALVLTGTTGVPYTVRLSNLDDAAFREIPMPERTTSSGSFKNYPLALALSDDGQLLAAAVDARYAGVGAPSRPLGYLWDVASLDLVATFGSTQEYPNQASSVAIAPGGNWVAVADEEIEELILFDVGRAAESRYVVDGVCGFEHLAASPDGTLLAADMVSGSPCSDSSVRRTVVVDIAAGAVVATLPGGSNGALAFLSSSSLVRGEADGATSVWCLQ